MTNAISTTQPTFVMATNNINKQPIAVRVDDISTMETLQDGIVLKDPSGRCLGRVENTLNPEDIAKKIGNVLDLQA
ncbi:MAG: hypothetical protein PHE78_06705 [Candidatus Gastranaerophilales bacterium]|nr:hypothetical protein [Candidatus Gastranaerophilales bacterium]